MNKALAISGKNPKFSKDTRRFAKQEIVNFAVKLGFDYVGVTSVESLERGVVARNRVREGFMEGLPWFTEDRVLNASSPNRLLPEAQSVISLAVSYYYPLGRENVPEPRGKVARYAWGLDYHPLLKGKARQLVHFMQSQFNSCHNRIFVDDGPLLERAVAERSGIAWYGKNTMMITRGHGSWVLLAEILTDLSLPEDLPMKKNCGACTICIDKCPTGALTPYALDNQKCISFWTIEHKGIIPREIRPLIGTWVFGCDLCQDVCPVNRNVQPTKNIAFLKASTHIDSLDLIDLLKMTPLEYQRKFKGSTIKRAKLTGLKRNACIALGNLKKRKGIEALEITLLNGDPVVRVHAAWALGQIGGKFAEKALKQSLLHHQDQTVIAEIDYALNVCAISSGEGR